MPFLLPLSESKKSTPGVRAYKLFIEAIKAGGQDSNLQPAVLETAALPIEPPPFEVFTSGVRVASHLSTPPLPPKPWL